MKLKTLVKFATVLLFISMISCSKQTSNNDSYYSKTTGWKYNVQSNSGWRYNDRSAYGFDIGNAYNAVAPSGMVAIPGGSYIIGEKGDFVMSQRNNKPHRITVSPFYMDEYEIRNIDWHEYVNWVKTIFGKVAPGLVDRVQPHVTGNELSFNEPFMTNYLTHPAFNNYPVVGVTWEQAVDYCSWRTDRVNELALIKSGQLNWPDLESIRKQTNADSIAYNFVFNTKKYLIQDTYVPPFGKNPGKDPDGKFRKANLDDGMMVADFRLPTEAEWEYAAYGINPANGDQIDSKVYPWSGTKNKKLSKKQQAQMQANYIHGRGDMQGNPGRFNGRATFTCPVNANSPNDFGLYNMAGNVNEWVMDVYRPLTFEDAPDYNPFRGNAYATPVIERVSPSGERIYKVDEFGRIAMKVKKGDDMSDYLDGDPESALSTDFPLITDTIGLSSIRNGQKIDPTDVLAPRYNNKIRVYKGGSWKDRAYWLNPSTRRYLEQDKSANDLGFRCAMSMIGDISKKK
jgi:gliding motility-associated lipoprotein GldJ